jgi:hypothetical protein
VTAKKAKPTTTTHTMTATLTYTSKPDLAEAVAEVVCGSGVYKQVLASAPAAAEIFEQLRAFVDGPYGQALTAYFEGWEKFERHEDWMTDARMNMIKDVDTIFYGICGLLEGLSAAYGEGGTGHAVDLATEVVARIRGEVVQ